MFQTVAARRGMAAVQSVYVMSATLVMLARADTWARALHYVTFGASERRTPHRLYFLHPPLCYVEALDPLSRLVVSLNGHNLRDHISYTSGGLSSYVMTLDNGADSVLVGHLGLSSRKIGGRSTPQIPFVPE